MSAAEIKAVKAAVAKFAAQTRRDSIKPAELNGYVIAQTGLNFGPLTVTKYLKAHGWTRRDDQPAGLRYVRPEAAAR